MVASFDLALIFSQTRKQQLENTVVNILEHISRVSKLLYLHIKDWETSVGNVLDVDNAFSLLSQAVAVLAIRLLECPNKYFKIQRRNQMLKFH